jgi:hypothetical protein
MGSFFASVGFPYNGTDEFVRLCMNTKHEGEIITTSSGTYYRLGVPIPDADEFEIELWLKETHDGEHISINAHMVGPTEGKVCLLAALNKSEGQHYEGAYRCDCTQWLMVGEEMVRMPFVFDCPNFDCGENFILPHFARTSFCGLGASLTCYEDETDYLVRSNKPPPAYMFAHDFIRNGTPFMEPLSPIAHITGWVDDTRIITNPVTDCDFTWATIDVGDMGLMEVVAAPDGLDGFIREGGVVSGTVWLSGRLIEW